MSVSDVSNLAIAVATAIGVIIALVTFSRSLAGRAKLDMSLGPEILLHYTSDRKLIVTADFSFLNRGAMPGLITEISTIIDETGKRLVWRRYEVSGVTGRDPKNGSTLHWTRSGEQVGPLIVPGRTSGYSSITRTIRLYEEDIHAGHPLSADKTREATFTVWATAATKQSYQYKYRLFMEPYDLAYLAAYCKEKDGRWENRLVLRQQPRTDADKREVKRDGLLYKSRGLLNELPSGRLWQCPTCRRVERVPRPGRRPPRCSGLPEHRHPTAETMLVPATENLAPSDDSHQFT